MFVRFLLVLFFVNFGLSPVSATDELTDAPIVTQKFKEVINTFAKAGLYGFKDQAIPQGIVLKKKLTLYPEEIEVEGKKFFESRKTTLRIKLLTPEVLSSAHNVQLKRLPTVGSVVLIERPNNSGPDGKFSLHLIEIDTPFQGGGYGGCALDVTLLLSQYLASKSHFYDRLTLQCADEDNGRQLGNVPHRLAYYLNRGFEIDAITLEYMRHLDTRYFIERLTQKQFNAFVSNYLPETLNDFSSKQRESILLSLRMKASSMSYLEPDAIMQMAESSSSEAAKAILNCLYYDGCIGDAEQRNTGFYIYLMHLDVRRWAELLERRKATAASRLQPSPHIYADNNSVLSKVCQWVQQIIQEQTESSHYNSDQENIHAVPANWEEESHRPIKQRKAYQEL